MKKGKILWFSTLILSILYIVIGYKISTANFTLMSDPDYKIEKAEVISIEKNIKETTLQTQNEEYSKENKSIKETSLIFRCRIASGENEARELDAVQIDDELTPLNEKKVEVGDKILIFNVPNEKYSTEWVFGSYIRHDKVIVLAAIFFILMIVLGFTKGLNTLISLILTCGAVLLVFIPSILSGHNIYIGTAITSLFIITTTLIITNGGSIKTLATTLGCAFGVTVSAIFTLYFDKILKLSGFTNGESISLTMLETPVPMNLNAIIFAAIVIGAMGAVMDVAMDISSALYEIKLKVKDITAKQLFKSGITIGRDIMGTMANTLVLAYIGSSLSTVLILIVTAQTFTELINREMIIVEIVQALIGSTAILLTIPLTAAICALLYAEHHTTITKKETETRKETNK
ncbi:MAG: YibE/F family protein [Synergistaceae bacterium]